MFCISKHIIYYIKFVYIKNLEKKNKQINNITVKWPFQNDHIFGVPGTVPHRSLQKRT